MSGSAKRHGLAALKLMGQKFNKLLIQNLTKERTKDGHIIVKCLCDCGVEFTTMLSLIKKGEVKSCGCLNSEAILKNLEKAKLLQISREPKIASARKIYFNRYADGDLSFEEFLFHSQKDCYYCGAKPTTIFNSFVGKYAEQHPLSNRAKDGYFIYNGLDRINSSLGHIKENIVTCCPTCNRAKLAMTTKEFFLWIKTVYEFNLERFLK